MDIKEKYAALEAAGYRFERRSRSKGWVRIKPSTTSRQAIRAIEFAYANHTPQGAPNGNDEPHSL